LKAIQIHQFGGPEVLSIEDLAIPALRDGEILIELAFAGVNFIDVYMRNGTYNRSKTYATPLPMTLGMEGGGRVAALGAGVEGFSVGDRVAYCLVRGAYAGYAVVPTAKVVHVPEAISLQLATALILQGATAHYLSHSAFPLGSDHTCLIHAGAGGVGQLLIQLAKQRGARVIATVGSKDKAEIAKACGADATIIYRDVDFGEAVRALTSGRGVDVVYDSVGRDTLPTSLRSLRKRGTCISFGASSGQPAPLEVLDLAEAGSVFLTRPHLADYMAPDEVAWRASDLFAAVAEGNLIVTIEDTLPLTAAKVAHQRIEARKTRGKLLLDVSK
jgi:NADPH2:quinone reductase